MVHRRKKYRKVYRGRYFGKSLFRLWSSGLSKRLANMYKKSLKEDGFKVRTTKSKDGYDIWRRS